MNKYKKQRGKAFTLVEVLICVGIIGIIAAISIPAIISSTSEKALEVQRKALHSRMAQAIAQIKNLSKYKTSENNSANLFIVNALAKAYKITSICKAGSIKQCGIPDKVLDYYDDTHTDSYAIKDKTTFPLYNDKITAASLNNFAADYIAFRTANGESILLWYNPNCKGKKDSDHNLINSVCINMVYDLNGGANAPNSYGEDIGYMTVFYPTDSVIAAPVLYNKESFSGTYNDMQSKASDLDLTTPTIEELVSILVNKELTHITKTGDNANKLYWSSSYASSDSETKIWIAGLEDGVKTDKIKADDSSDKSYNYYLIKK